MKRYDEILFDELTEDEQIRIAEAVSMFAKDCSFYVANDVEFDQEALQDLMLVCVLYPDILVLLEEMAYCRTMLSWTKAYRQFDSLLTMYQDYHNISFECDWEEYEKKVER